MFTIITPWLTTSAETFAEAQDTLNRMILGLLKGRISRDEIAPENRSAWLAFLNASQRAGVEVMTKCPGGGKWGIIEDITA